LLQADEFKNFSSEACYLVNQTDTANAFLCIGKMSINYFNHRYLPLTGLHVRSLSKLHALHQNLNNFTRKKQAKVLDRPTTARASI